jgi:ribosomal protein L24E
MWVWKRMRKIKWTYRVRKEEVVHRAKEERYILYTIKGRKTNWIGHTMRRNVLLKPAVEGKLEGKI